MVLINNTKVISQFEESPADIGDPDIVLIEPFEVKDTGELVQETLCSISTPYLDIKSGHKVELTSWI